MFEPGNDHLELLFEFGLGTGDGGPWRRRLGAALDSPQEMVRGQLAWAITHGMTERVLLLVSHGTDLTSPLPGGATVTSMAATTGHADLVDYLVAHGAPVPGLDPAGAFVAAALATNRASLDRLLRDHPGLAGQVRSSRPALITWAAACGGPEAVEILASLGFDVNAMGRTDVPSDRPGRPPCTRRPKTAISSWPGPCCAWAPTRTSATTGSARPLWAGLATSASSRSSPCSSRSPPLSRRPISRRDVRAEDAPAYAAYVQQTGIAGYQRTPGNRGAWALWRVDGDRAEIVTVSLGIRSAIKAFAGRTSSGPCSTGRRPVPDGPRPDRPVATESRARPRPNARRPGPEGTPPACLHNSMLSLYRRSSRDMDYAEQETGCRCASTGSCPPTATARHRRRRARRGHRLAAARIRPASLGYLGQIARTAEQLGFDGVLTPTGTWCEDAWLATGGADRGQRAAEVPGRVPARADVARRWPRRWPRPTSGLPRPFAAQRGDRRRGRTSSAASATYLATTSGTRAPAEFLDIVRGVWGASRSTSTASHCQWRAPG